MSAPPVAPSRTRPPAPTPSRSATRRALRSTTGVGARRVLVILAWIVGAVGGAAPPTLLGDPPAGLLAGAVLGAAAWGWAAPLIATPWVAVVVGRDDDTGAATRFHAAGIGHRRRLVLRSTGAALDVATVGAVAAVAGMVAAAGSSVGTPVELGLRSGPGLDGLAAAGALLAGSILLGSLLAVAATGPTQALVAWATAVALTGSVITAATFVPSLQPAVVALPLLALWPFDPDDVLAPTLAVEVPVRVRFASLLAWSALLAAFGWWRRRHHPYPGTDLDGRRHRPRRHEP